MLFQIRWRAIFSAIWKELLCPQPVSKKRLQARPGMLKAWLIFSGCRPPRGWYSAGAFGLSSGLASTDVRRTRRSVCSLCENLCFVCSLICVVCKQRGGQNGLCLSFSSNYKSKTVYPGCCFFFVLATKEWTSSASTGSLSAERERASGVAHMVIWLYAVCQCTLWPV